MGAFEGERCEATWRRAHTIDAGSLMIIIVTVGLRDYVPGYKNLVAMLQDKQRTLGGVQLQSTYGLFRDMHHSPKWGMIYSSCLPHLASLSLHGRPHFGSFVVPWRLDLLLVGFCWVYSFAIRPCIKTNPAMGHWDVDGGLP